MPGHTWDRAVRQRLKASVHERNKPLALSHVFFIFRSEALNEHLLLERYPMQQIGDDEGHHHETKYAREYDREGHEEQDGAEVRRGCRTQRYMPLVTSVCPSLIRKKPEKLLFSVAMATKRMAIPAMSIRRPTISSTRFVSGSGVVPIASTSFAVRPVGSSAVARRPATMRT